MSFDDLEYALRLLSHGFDTYTVISSRHYHPAAKIASTTVLGRNIKYLDVPPWKRYYSLRNGLIVYRRYPWARSLFGVSVGRDLMLTLVSTLLIPGQRLKNAKCVLMGIADGLRQRTSRNGSVLI